MSQPLSASRLGLSRLDARRVLFALAVVGAVGCESPAPVRDTKDGARPTVGTLVERLRSKDGWLQADAARQLAAIGQDARAAVPDLAALLDRNVEHGVRRAAAEALLRLGPIPVAAVPALARSVDEEPSDDTARTTIAALAQIGPEAASALPALVRRYLKTAVVRKQPTDAVVGATVDAIERIDATRDLLRLVRQTQGSDVRARRAAVASLLRSIPTPATPLPDLLRLRQNDWRDADVVVLIGAVANRDPARFLQLYIERAKDGHEVRWGMHVGDAVLSLVDEDSVASALVAERIAGRLTEWDLLRCLQTRPFRAAAASALMQIRTLSSDTRKELVALRLASYDKTMREAARDVLKAVDVTSPPSLDDGHLLDRAPFHEPLWVPRYDGFMTIARQVGDRDILLRAYVHAFDWPLDSLWTWNRLAIALHVSQAYGRAATPELLRRVKHDNWSVRAGVVMTLGYIYANAREVPDEVVTAIAAAVFDSHGWQYGTVRWAAAEALGRIGPKAARAVPTLVHFLRHEEATYPELVFPSIVARAIGDIGASDEATTRALLGYLRDSASGLAYEALLKLGTPHETALRAFLDRLDHANAWVQTAALSQIRMTRVDSSVQGALVQRLIALLASPSEEVRQAVVQSLERHGSGNSEAIAALAQRLAADASQNVRRDAASALGALGGAAALAALKKAAGDSDPGVRAATAAGIKKVQRASGVQP